jgi:hypothetical protein
MWYGALVALLGAAGVYLAADYSNRYPDSLIGRCVINGCQVGTAHNPVVQLGEAGVERTFEAIKDVMDQPGMAPTTATLDPPEGVEVPADPEPVRKGEAVTNQGGAIGTIVLQPDPEEILGEHPPAGPAAGAEEAEVPPPMPPAREDDLPPKMPYATDEGRDVGASASDPWNRLLQEAARCPDVAPIEECEPTRSDDGACREDPNYHEQYPACPHMGACPHDGCCSHPGQCPGCPGLAPVVEDKAKLDSTHDAGEEQSTPVEKEPALPKCDRDGKCPTRKHGIDTMEFRPSDGKPFDFGSFPY